MRTVPQRGDLVCASRSQISLNFWIRDVAESNLVIEVEFDHGATHLRTGSISNRVKKLEWSRIRHDAMNGTRFFWGQPPKRFASATRAQGGLLRTPATSPAAESFIYDAVHARRATASDVQCTWCLGNRRPFTTASSGALGVIGSG